MYYKLTKTKIILYAIIIILMIVGAGLKIYRKTHHIDLNKEQLLEQRIDNNVLVLSDGGLTYVDSLDNSIGFKALLKTNGYTCEILTKEEGMFDAQIGNNVLMHNKYSEELAKFEHIIIQGGLFDFMSGNQIGQIDGENFSILGSLSEFVKDLERRKVSTNIILIGLPNCKEFNGEPNVIGNYIIDYEFTLKNFAKQYDNVYYISLYDYTKDNPISLSETEEYVFDEEIMGYIMEEINKIDLEYVNQNNKDLDNKDNQIIILPEDEE